MGSILAKQGKSSQTKQSKTPSQANPKAKQKRKLSQVKSKDNAKQSKKQR